MFANYHTHTSRCHHARGEDREYVEHAIKGGYKILGFSDHCPWIFRDDYVSRTRMTPSQLDDYFTSLLKLKKEYADDIKIYIGFESEYIPELMEAQDRLLEDYPVDYMILGEHFTEREPYGEYTGAETPDEARLKKYTDLIIEGMESGKYVYTAHPDLINYTGDLKVYDEQMLRLCLYMKAHGLPVEINLLGMMQGRHYPGERFFRIAQEVGNTAIIGSDAHTPEVMSSASWHEKCRLYAERFGLELIDFLPGLGI